jgi:hypothetical protein
MQTGLGRFLKKNIIEVILFTSFLIFACLLMWKTLQTDTNGNILIATKTWSDFAATIPLIRSFSYGANFPPEYPIFAGPPIRYHFVFFALVGMLEKFGVPLSWALNTLSASGFFLLLILVYLLGKTLFKSKAVGIISTILFLFNGSFGFLEFFKKNPLSLNTFTDIYKNTSFSSFGPYDGNVVSAFWNLNIYTNQRHLAISYALFLFLTLSFYYFSLNPKKLGIRKIAFLGILIGILPSIHLAVFGMIGVTLFIYFVVYPKLRRQIFMMSVISFSLALPQIVYMGPSQIETKLINPGYLIENINLVNFINYWVLNLGLVVVLAPLGFLLISRQQKKYFLPFLSFFVIGNIFQLSPEIAANHKFFNLFLIGAIFLTAFSVYRIYTKNLFGKILVTLIFPFLIITGIIDIFPIINDRLITIKDIPNNRIAAFIAENTPKNSVFLNSSYLYNPASLAGRKIFMGWPYFAWSAGYDTDKRGKMMEKIFTSEDRVEICTLLKQNSIDYVTVQDTTNNHDFPEINLAFFEENFTSLFSDGKDFKIYQVSQNCN